MQANRGKDFENQFKEQIELLKEISLDRFPDPGAGFLGVRNISDFGLYKYPYQYYIECKAVRGNTLNFKDGISKGQWEGMEEKSLIRGVTAGVLVWFIEHDKTVFVNIIDLLAHRLEGKKSLNIKEIIKEDIKYIELEGRKKRVFFEYNMEKFMADIYSQTKYNWRLIGGNLDE